MYKWIFAVLLLSIFAGALALRLPRLDERPMHADEAVQAVKFGDFVKTGVYRYDPREFHGPALNYLTLPAWWGGGAKSFSQTSETTYRLVPVFFGAGLVLLLLLVVDGLGRPAALCAGLLTAISPAMVFFSRYYIHEMLLVFFSFAAIGCLWRYLRYRTRLTTEGFLTTEGTEEHGGIVRYGGWGWTALTGAALGMMFATKETCIIAFAAMFLGVLYVLEREQFPGVPEVARRFRAMFPLRFIAIAAGTFSFVAVLFFSSFFTHADGPLDSLRAYATYFSRAGGTESPHQHPPGYYWHLLLYYKDGPGPAWTEGLIVLLALPPAINAFRSAASSQSAPLARFLTVYTLILAFAYSFIPYKTPWCLLGFLHGMILLAGIGAAEIVKARKSTAGRVIACALLIVAAGHLARQACLLNFRYSSEPRNPWVYAHTSGDAVKLALRLDDLAAVHPDGRRLRVAVAGNDYWPLPWYLRRFPRAVYNPPPAQFVAPVVIAMSDQAGGFRSVLGADYREENFGLRHGVKVVVFVKSSLWDAYLKQKSQVEREK